MYIVYHCCVWICLCVGVFVFVCIWGKRRRWGEEKLLSLLNTEKREREKMSERKINKIINGRVTITVYIYTIIVARVEIYTFLYTFRGTDVEHFWNKICKSCVFFYFTWFCIHISVDFLADVQLPHWEYFMGLVCSFTTINIWPSISN